MSYQGFIASGLTGLNIFFLPPAQPEEPFRMPCVFTPAGIVKARRNLTGFDQGFADLSARYPQIELLRGSDSWYIDGLRWVTDDYEGARLRTYAFARHAREHLGVFCEVHLPTYESVASRCA